MGWCICVFDFDLDLKLSPEDRVKTRCCWTFGQLNGSVIY